MQDLSGAPGSESEIAAFRARSGALRQSAALPGAPLPQLLEAAFAELDGAIDAAARLRAEAVPAGDQGADSTDAERRLLRAMFASAPVPMFLLDRDGTVRRANVRAGELLGSGTGYATGKALTAFVDLPSRAAVHSQLAAVVRTGKGRRVACSLLGRDAVISAVLLLDVIDRGAEPGLVMAAAIPVPSRPPAAQDGAQDGTKGGAEAGTRAAPKPGQRATPAPPPASSTAPAAGDTVNPAPADDSEALRTVEAITHRLDVVTAATRLLLENATFSESVTLQRCARLLAGELAAWVIVDVERRQRLRRQVVMGPAGADAEHTARVVGGVDPQPGSAPRQVHDTGSSMLLAHAGDLGILGTSPDGVPLLMQLGATSLLSVPLTDGEHSYGVLTLARRGDERHFEIADLGLVEELGEQLALAIRVDRMFRRRTEIADMLQASLLPRELPAVPGTEISAAYVAATDGIDVGGDFYDVFRTPDGWGLSIGDVCGKGEDAAAVTAAARHGIRTIAHWNSDPFEVLSQANELLLSQEYDGRFVTACAALLRWEGKELKVVIGGAGHPAPVVVRQDGRVQMLAGGGMPLGIFADSEASREEVTLTQGDVLFLYTDGITEARNLELAYFADRLEDELSLLAGQSPKDIVTAMQALVLEFSASELRDDMTMMVLRAGEPPLPAPA
jgi:serine phosphatase RsbU (regulator of sigma subunit)/PAS domain-containing protein